MLGIVCLYSDLTCFSDVTYIICLLTCSLKYFLSIRNLFWILTGIFLPAFMYPIMYHLWAEIGTGNANYLFFQTLLLWSSYSFLIIEFTRNVVLNTLL